MEAKAEMMRALKGLEELVKKGRDSLAAERSRHEKVRRKACVATRET